MNILDSQKSNKDIPSAKATQEVVRAPEIKFYDMQHRNLAWPMDVKSGCRLGAVAISEDVGIDISTREIILRENMP